MVHNRDVDSFNTALHATRLYCREKHVSHATALHVCSNSKRTKPIALRGDGSVIDPWSRAADDDVTSPYTIDCNDNTSSVNIHKRR